MQNEKENNMDATIVKSAANTGQNYIVLQARMINGKIKFQGIGKNVNRDYGVSDSCDKDCLLSLASFLELNA
jgi:hypothetical protein